MEKKMTAIILATLDESAEDLIESFDVVIGATAEECAEHLLSMGYQYGVQSSVVLDGIERVQITGAKTA